jgi:NADH:ubiquinone oxidoreductase subunit E
MACECKIDDVLESSPEKKAELIAFMDTLPKSDDIQKQRGSLIAVLHKAQGIFGYLPQSVQLLVAKTFRIQLSDVYGVISFYSFFTTTPPGKYKVHVCTGTACFVRGADRVLSEFEEQLGIKDGETRDDLEYSLGGLRCVGACSLAPVVMVNDKVYGKVTPDMVESIIKECE